ncbi:uncharacterized protein LOC134820752 [Bolinopsis microptera]|uniref:uncharacterized protein LOC134820752 n=1 Tax=Bolinopsis microptera TaxID=2820187 RepID=UPI00307A88F4
MKSLKPVQYGCSNDMKRRKRTLSPTKVRFEDLPTLKQKGSFRTLARAMKWGCAMRNIGQKYTMDPDLEVHEAYQGIFGHYGGRGLDRFRKLVTMVCRMIRAINVFRQHARDTGRPVHVERLAHDGGFSSQIPLHPLSFDPKLYSPKEFQYRMEKEARNVLQSPWMTRTEEQIRHVWVALRHLKEFRNMTKSMQIIMSRYARYEKHGKNRTIVRRGDPGRHYYFIYSGQVELRNSNTMADAMDEKDLPKLGTGQDFGHVALLHMERRTATVVCTEETEFIVLDRRGNGRAVYRALLTEHKRKCNFLKTLEIFQDLDEDAFRSLTDHGRIADYLPTSLVATVQSHHPHIYAIVQGVANVALTTDVYSCCVENEQQRELLKRLDKQRNKCRHKPDKLHDVFTQHDPKLSLVIQHLKERHIFGMQHMLHSSKDLPTLHLIAKSKLTVLTIPVSSVQFFAKPHALHIATEKYPLYPSVVDLIRRYMEDSVWDLYKAHVIRDLKHYEGRVDPSKKCKYCLSCQLRTLMVPSIMPDPVRDEVTNLYCPGNSSPLPHLAKETFRPASAPPLVTPRNRNKKSFRSLNNSPKMPAQNNSSRIGDVVPLFRSSVASKNARFRPRPSSEMSRSGSVERPTTARSKISRPRTAASGRPCPDPDRATTTKSYSRPVSVKDEAEPVEKLYKMVSSASFSLDRSSKSSLRSEPQPKTSTGKPSLTINL